MLQHSSLIMKTIQWGSWWQSLFSLAWHGPRMSWPPLVNPGWLNISLVLSLVEICSTNKTNSVDLESVYLSTILPLPRGSLLYAPHWFSVPWISFSSRFGEVWMTVPFHTPNIFLDSLMVFTTKSLEIAHFLVFQSAYMSLWMENMHPVSFWEPQPFVRGISVKGAEWYLFHE